ncbi:MAG TPA: 8-amino-7-oxononanoate synthase [Gammaproteobacteria bacterium]|nr:8-amino-7-oxononanoate synthase [Gammaproteobacteria bacterium]
MHPAWRARIERALAERRAKSLYRERRVLDSPQGARVVIEGREYLNFSSNDYLGLAADPRVIEAMNEAARLYGAGSGAAHLVSGHLRIHHELEERLAEFLGRERALLFSSGYMANLGIGAALLKRGDAVFEDRLNHASLIDAGLASGARFARYRHNDGVDLAARLANAEEAMRLVMTDGVFSMDGDLAPLNEIAAIAERHEACLVVDDAHGIGVLGENGRGTLEHFAVIDRVPVLMGTLGKALGSFGAFVAGEGALIELLINEARTYVYTTALPPAAAAAAIAALEIVEREPERRAGLRAKVKLFQDGLRALGLPVPESITPIQPIVLGSAEAALAAAHRLREAGMLVPAIRPPTVPPGTARLRVSLSAAHGEEDIARLLEALSRLGLGESRNMRQSAR